LGAVGGGVVDDDEFPVDVAVREGGGVSCMLKDGMSESRGRAGCMD